MAKPFNYSKMAGYIIDAMVFGLNRACEMHSVSIPTGCRWRKIFEADTPDGDKLRDMVSRLKIATLDPIEPELNKAVDKHIKWMHESIDYADKLDMKAMSEVRENYRVLSEMQMVGKMLDAKLAQFGHKPTQRLEPETVDAIATEAR